MKDPHPYLQIWLGCRRYSSDFQRLLPESGGWLDQPVEVMLAFDVCDRIYTQEQRAKEQFEKLRTEQTRRDLPQSQRARAGSLTTR